MIDLTKPDWAYIFGFIQADGHLWEGTQNRGKMTIELAIKDVDILEKIKPLIPYPTSLRTRTRDTNFKKSYESATLCVNMLEFRSELKSLGIIPGKKSPNSSVPKVPYSERDYWRGWMDGDGSLGFTDKGIPFVAFCTKSEIIARAFVEYMEPVCGATRKIKPNTRDKMYNLTYTKESAQKIAKFLYVSEDLVLNRKYLLSKEIQTWARPSTMKVKIKKFWTPEETEIIWSHSVQDAALILGRTEISIRSRIWYLTNKEAKE